MGDIFTDILGHLEQERRSPDEILREILVSPPVHESEIGVGDYALLAQPQPIGIVQVQIFHVGQVIDGKLDYGVRAFHGVLDNGERGYYEAELDTRLRLVGDVIKPSPLGIYDQSAVVGDYTNFSYENGILTVTWDNEKPANKNDQSIHSLTSKEGISVTFKGDPNQRIIPPGSSITRDKNTIEYKIEENSYRIVQRIPGGPRGHFNLPGYRKLNANQFDYFESKVK